MRKVLIYQGFFSFHSEFGLLLFYIWLKNTSYPCKEDSWFLVFAFSSNYLGDRWRLETVQSKYSR